MIVAINKIDKPDANPDKVRTDLLQHEVSLRRCLVKCRTLKSLRSQVRVLINCLRRLPSVRNSGAESQPRSRCSGAVIEAQLDVGRGPVATVLVQNGYIAQWRYLRCG